MVETVMVKIRRILCPVDFSDFSRRALDYAIAVAKWYGSRLIVLYVYQPPMPALAPLVALAGSVEAAVLPPGALEQLRRQIAAFIPPEAAAHIVIEPSVAEGDPTAEILAQAESADLIVMGTHGRSGFEHLVLGSVTEKVLRKASCPLLTIPLASPDATSAVPTLFHRIVAAVDFSDISMPALRFAMSLAAEADAHLTMMHVIDVPPHLALWIDRGDGVGHVREWTDAAEQRLRSVVSDAAREYAHVEQRVETGQPYREILRVAAEQQASLIVIGAHGRGLLERMFVGSTAQHVVRQATCPVLTIRTRQKSSPVRRGTGD
jgi:nucleotide-binding universal stress UspA family protein